MSEGMLGEGNKGALSIYIQEKWTQYKALRNAVNLTLLWLEIVKLGK